MAEGKGPDEIYCRSCGSAIKRAAEICPECGVPNEASEMGASTSGGTNESIFCRGCGDEMNSRATICPHCGVANPLAKDGASTTTPANTASSTSGATTSPSGVHDPSDYTTTVSSNWHWGVASSVTLWILGMALPVESVAGMFMLVGWVLMPVSIYFDKRWLRANTSWNPNAVLWIIGSLVLLVNVVVGAVYLVRRHSVAKDAVTGDAVPADDEPEDDALAVLRRRYSQGEIGDAEFEARVEKILETEDRDTARHLVDEELGQR